MIFWKFTILFFLQLLQKFLACPGMGRIAGHYHTCVRVDSLRCLEPCNGERRTPCLIILDVAYFKGILDRILYGIHRHAALCHALLHMLADGSDCHIIGAQTNKSSFQDFNIFVRACPLLCVHILPPSVAGVILDRAAAILMPPTLPAARPGKCRFRQPFATTRRITRGRSPVFLAQAAVLHKARRARFAQQLQAYPPFVEIRPVLHAILPRVYLKNPQHCSILLKSSACCVAQPWNTSSIPAVSRLAFATF